MQLLGCGQFGSVHKCRHLVDGAMYAVKQSKHAIDVDEMALREAHTHGMLASHAHVVRYYSAWLEERRLFMQFEYCNGGSLLDEIARHREGLSDLDVRNLLLQVAQGLQHIHANDLVHLDIKPGNIFLCRQRRTPADNTLSPTGCRCCKTPNKTLSTGADPGMQCIYKIGDFGLAQRLDLTDQTLDLEEGDCRYLSREVLERNFSDLPKADIFSLSLTAYEALGGGPLPMNGPEWQEIRSGVLAPLPGVSNELHQLLVAMIRVDFPQRPSAASLTNNAVLSPFAWPSYNQLRIELNKERLKNERLKRQLEEMQNLDVAPGMTLRPLDGKSRPRRTVVNSRPSYPRSQSVF